MSEVTSRKAKTGLQKYLIAKDPLRPASVNEVDLAKVKQELSIAVQSFAMQDTDGTPVPPPTLTAMANNTTGEIHTLAAELTEEQKTALENKHDGAIIIEEDSPLQMLDSSGIFEMAQNTASSAASDTLTVILRILDPDGNAVPNASVTLGGEIWSDEQLTNTQGNVTLKLHGETLDTLSELRIKPKSGYWSRIINNPNLQERGSTVTLVPLPASTTTPQIDLWGNTAVGIVSIPTAAPMVKVAVIDSGLAEDHPDLDPAGGFGMEPDGDAAEDWKNDGSGHGTHVSGTISALNNGFGMRGVTDRVEVFALQVFPKATMSKLIAALDKAIELEVDVINMSLGGTTKSAILQARLQAVRAKGILSIAAAGNNGGAVMYPAAYPEVMAVAAVGRTDSFPEDSFHTRHVSDQVSADGTYFTAQFSCRGPEIDVCGPGVAVISTVPGKTYAAFDGTSMASPHIAGLSAAKLAQTPAIFNMPRTDARATALFDAVIASCVDLGMDPTLQGRGMPVLIAGAAPAPAPIPQPPTSDKTDALKDVSDLLARAIAKAKSISA
ncbi:MAG: S8 family serine peptidase [Sulfitobacter sp.]